MNKISVELAFPVTYIDKSIPGQENLHVHTGMSLRDYFAAKAMPLVAEIAELEHTGPDEWARACYEIADAMLKARAS